MQNTQNIALALLLDNPLLFICRISVKILSIEPAPEYPVIELILINLLDTATNLLNAYFSLSTVREDSNTLLNLVLKVAKSA